LAPVAFPLLRRLLVHGTADLRTPVDQSKLCASALKPAGKPCWSIGQPLGDHRFSRFEGSINVLKAARSFPARRKPAD